MGLMNERAVKKLLAKARFKFRSDSLANWETNNPILLAGEAGVVTGLNEVGDGLENETQKIKFGDGTHTWNELDWWYGPTGAQGTRGAQGERGRSVLILLREPTQYTRPNIPGYSGSRPNTVWQVSRSAIITSGTIHNIQVGDTLRHGTVLYDCFFVDTSHAYLSNRVGISGSSTVTVSQTYNPTSYNAMSGVAVAEAIEQSFGDIETALDNIIAIQNSLIGGGSV